MSAVNNLNEAGPKAVQAILNAVAPHETPGDKLSADSLQALSDKLNQLFPDGSSSLDQQVDKEGLPVVEVTESSLNSSVNGEGNSLISDEDPLVPAYKLTPEERQARVEERDRILDLLEQEEDQARVRERQQLLEESTRSMEIRKQQAQAEMARLKAKKELNQKMGKALMKQMAEAREASEKKQQETSEKDFIQEQTRKQENQRPKKKVSFAALPQTEASSSDDWGDVAKARLRSPTTPYPKGDSTLPMKSFVVERSPGKTPPDSSHTSLDSDDESDPELPHTPSPSASEQEDGPTDDTDYDFDSMAHQREVAAEYFQRRAKITTDSLSVVTELGSPDDDPSDRQLAKPPISRFRAERLTSSFNASSSQASVAPAALPETSTSILQTSIRMGKLDEQGRLVGDEDSEPEDPTLLDNIEQLKKDPTPPEPSSAYLPPIPPLPSAKNKMSRFKLSQLEAVDPWETPVSSPARSSPKLTTPSSPGTPTTCTTETQPDRLPGQDPFSMIIESPSFPRASSPQGTSKMKNLVLENAAERQSGPEGKAKRPPVVMSSSVMERSPGQNPSANSPAHVLSPRPPQRQSKFSAARTPAGT